MSSKIKVISTRSSECTLLYFVLFVLFVAQFITGRLKEERCVCTLHM